LGWLGDIQAFAQTAMYQMDVASFLSQWLREVRGAQTKDGRFPDFAPHPFQPEERYSGTPGWGDAGVSLPFDLYVNYHDQRLVKASLPSIEGWLGFIEAKNPDLVWRNARGNDYGDWLNGDTWKFKDAPKGNAMPKDAFATAFFAHSADLAARLLFASGDVAKAKALGDLARRVREAFQKTFVDEHGVVAGDTQAGYALAIAFDLLGSSEAKRAAADRLAAKIRAQGCLTTGFPSTNRALIALSDNGHHDLAVDLMTRTSLPSFGYQIENGATTVWERMDGFTKEGGFQDPSMNSFSHFAFGAVGEWMMRKLAGIEPDEDAYVSMGSVALMPVLNGATKSSAEGPLAWQHFRLAPRIGDGLSFVRASHDTIAGRIESAWKLDGDTLEYECTIPPGTRASLRLPVADAKGVRESGKTPEEAGLVGFKVEGGVATCELAAGHYNFRCKAR
jgi:alpha-L-rhamnosidase